MKTPNLSSQGSLSLRAGLRHIGRYLLVGLLPVALLGGCVTPGDYGDAPDGRPTQYPIQFAQTGQFPTLRASGGAVARNVDEARLGPTASVEADANDPVDPDGQPNLNPANTDSDDGIVDFVVVLTSIPPRAGMTVNVTGPPGSPGGTYFINVLIDLNLDGRWGGVAGPGLVEWAVRNFPVVVTPGSTQQVALPQFLFGFGNRLPDSAWMRIALSRESIPDADWDGSGRFAADEVEDHVIDLPDAKPCMPVLSFKRREIVPRGAPAIVFTGTLSNVGGDPCSVTYRLDRLSGGVTIFGFAPPQAVVSCVPPQFVVTTSLQCGPVPLPAGGPGVLLSFVAIRGDLPSRYTYRASAVDPPSVVTPTGVTVGFGDSTGDVEFVEAEIKINKAFVTFLQEWVILRLQAVAPDFSGEFFVVLKRGDQYRGMTWETLREHGEGPITIPDAKPES